VSARRYESWGRYPKAHHDAVLSARWRAAPLPLPESTDQSLLPFGNGRSYGDVCLNDGHVLLDARPLDRFIAFDSESGVLRCEAGVLLSEILDLVVPRGWFLPVTPGTRLVTVGGAIANDVHGKNHHRAGTFGCHVRAFELLRSDGSRRFCSAQENTEHFRATIGGLGLIGLITWAELQLRRIASPAIAQEAVRYDGLDAFFALSAESDQAFEYTVAWVDCLSSGSQLGRGVFIRGNHVETPSDTPPKPPGLTLAVPFTPPVSAINGLTLKAFNAAYFYGHPAGRHASIVHYAPFFHPLDGVADWNRIYGPKGFLQYQFVVPHAHGPEAVREILQRIARAGTGSFLAVLKVFGAPTSPGLLSFPGPGVTLALDFPNLGTRTFDFLDSLDEVVREAGGRLYPAKDARMRGADFRAAYPEWTSLEALRDPRLDSSFWRRVRGEAP
jgi:FAD/FMN-containing dehydrogenase